MRGSDPDAAVYYLARMLYAGEDVKFIARRIMILASEDIGNADPMAMVVAASAAAEVERVGMPEAQIILSQAVTYMACAPKSNASYNAISAAMSCVKQTKTRLFRHICRMPITVRQKSSGTESGTNTHTTIQITM